MTRVHSAVMVFLSVFLLLAPGTYADEKIETEGLVDKATTVVQAFAVDSNLSWFRDHVKEAKALLIIPQSLKGAFLVGGSGGAGVLVARDAASGEWGSPAFYTVGSISIGVQIGAESAEVVLMIMTERGMEKLLTSSFKLGADISAAIGPIGSGTAAKTADVLSFSRSKGAFVGMSLDGAVVKTRDGKNAAYYGQAASPTDIIIRKSVSNPQAEKLKSALAELTAKQKS